jgi:preprotein translocase subunit SecA
LEDEIAQSYFPIALMRLLRVLRMNRGSKSSWIDKTILYGAQNFAERYHAKIRKQLLKMDQQVSKMLAFSGKSE